MKNRGERLKAAREYLGLTQEQVASVLDMTRNMIVNIEDNNRTIKPNELYKFSKIYGISIEEIISDEKESNVHIPLFVGGFESLSNKDQQEILNLIRFKNLESHARYKQD